MKISDAAALAGKIYKDEVDHEAGVPMQAKPVEAAVYVVLRVLEEMGVVTFDDK